MNIPFLTKAEAVNNTVPEDIARVLVSQFQVQSPLPATWRCYTKKSTFGGLPVDNVRLYDTAKTPKFGNKVKGYDDLSLHTGAILFEGYRDRNGLIHLSKRGASSKTGGPSVVASVKR